MKTLEELGRDFSKSQVQLMIDEAPNEANRQFLLSFREVIENVAELGYIGGFTTARHIAEPLAEALFEIANMPPSAEAAGKMKKIAQDLTRSKDDELRDSHGRVR